MHIVVYRQHGKLNMETQHIGPFTEEEDAYAYCSYLPALGVCPDGANPGVKYVEPLMTPAEHERYLKLEVNGFDSVRAKQLATIKF